MQVVTQTFKALLLNASIAMIRSGIV